MRGAAIYSTAVCVLGASALVIPSGLDDIDRHEDQWRPALLDPAVRHRIETPCRTCAFTSFDVEDYDDDVDAAFDEEAEYLEVQPGERKLELEFSISRDGQRLQLDGEPIFPSQFYRSSARGGRPIYAVQMPESDPYTAAPRRGPHRLPLEVTSFGITVVEPALSVDEPKIVENDVSRQLQVQLRIVSLEKQAIDADEVVVYLLRTNNDELVIMKMEHLSSSRQTPPSPSSPPTGAMVPSSRLSLDSSCGSLPASACRFRKAVEQKLEALRNGDFGLSRPCSGMRGTGPRRPSFGDMHGPPSRHGPPPPFTHGEDFHHHRHHRHHFLHSITRAIIAVLIPVMAGVVTGLMVSFVGLLVGRVLGYMWIAVAARRNRRGTTSTHDCCRRQSMVKALATAEEAGLLAEGEGETLPPYEDAPAYETIPHPPSTTATQLEDR